MSTRTHAHGTWGRRTCTSGPSTRTATASSGTVSVPTTRRPPPAETSAPRSAAQPSSVAHGATGSRRSVPQDVCRTLAWRGPCGRPRASKSSSPKPGADGPPSFAGVRLHRWAAAAVQPTSAARASIRRRARGPASRTDTTPTRPREARTATAVTAKAAARATSRTRVRFPPGLATAVPSLQTPNPTQGRTTRGKNELPAFHSRRVAQATVRVCARTAPRRARARGPSRAPRRRRGPPR